MIECPRCGNELPDILSRDNWETGKVHCFYCNCLIIKKALKSMITADDFFACHEGDIDSGDFDPEYECEDCMRTECVFAGSSIGDGFGYVQDEEGNCCYPDDLD